MSDIAVVVLGEARYGWIAPWPSRNACRVLPRTSDESGHDAYYSVWSMVAQILLARTRFPPRLRI